MSMVEQQSNLTLVGRSSSHFTRVTRLFAAELDIAPAFQVVRDLLSLEPADYGGNPALKLPALHTPQGTWFGALNICQELARRSSLKPQLAWPHDLQQPLLASFQELTVQAMSTEVSLILAKVSGGSGGPHQDKMQKSLAGSMSWLEAQVDLVLGALPAARDLSYLEVTLFCLVTHLEFREVLPTLDYPRLRAFCSHFAERQAAQATAYRFDA